MRRGATRKSASTGGSPSVQWLPLLVAATVISTLAGGAGIGLWKLASLPVDRVAVSGDLERVSRPELMAVINRALDGGFLWVDLDAVREPLEALPWVHRAVVRRRWPDSIEVQVIEQTAIARWGDGSLLNHAGEVFTPGEASRLEGLPLLSGPANSHRALMLEYRRIHQQLQPLGLRIDGLHMNRRGGMEATLSDGARLVFGRGDIDQKLARLRAVMAAKEADLQPSQIDLRYSHGLAIAWQNDSN
ncbi:MAG: cell division protein FtsQ/DivIB [Pseudomonadota bacterium]